MTELQKILKEEIKKTTPDLETFGKIINDYIAENDCMMVVNLQAGGTDAVIDDNLGIGPVGQFYFLLAALPPVFQELMALFDKSGRNYDKEGIIDSMLDLVKKEILED